MGKPLNNINDLRRLLLDTLLDLRDGKINANDANAVSKGAQAVINLTKLQIEFIQQFSPEDSTEIKFLENSESKKDSGTD